MLDMPINHALMLQQLHEFCEINSGSRNLEGLALLHDTVSQAFKPLADTIDSISMPQVETISMTGESLLEDTGKALFIRKRPHLKRRVLLCGHMDTVYGIDHSFQKLKQLNQNMINGPGVADMKGGLIVMLHALLAFEQTQNASQLGWDVFINADEELGSAASSPTMIKLAQHCQAALIYEPTLTPDGLLAKNRKGNIKITLIATGRSAHSGRDFESGRNAICYLAEIITAINALNGQRARVTLNIGKIAGGLALNVIPDKAIAKIDVRISAPEDSIWVQQQLEAIHQHYKKIDYTLTVKSRFDRPVKCINAATEKLFRHLCSQGKRLNLKLGWKDCGGCCDGNNVAQNGIPVLDSLGVRGGNIHTPDEYILLDSLIERALLSAYLLADLADGGLEKLELL